MWNYGFPVDEVIPYWRLRKWIKLFKFLLLRMFATIANNLSTHNPQHCAKPFFFLF